MAAVVDALVIGAGVAGSTLAYALAQAGWTVVLADKSRFPRHKACGEFLSPESVMVLRSLGLESAVRSLDPALIHIARLHAERGGSLEIPMPVPALGISRHALDARLQQAAKDAGAVVLTSCPAAGIKELDGQYRAELGPDKEPIFARTVFGAWGRMQPQSMQRSADFRSSRARIGIKAHLSCADGDSSSVVDLYFFRDGYVGIAGVEGGRLNAAALLAGTIPPAGLQKAGLQQILAQAAERVPLLGQRLAGAHIVPGTFAGAYPVASSRKPLPWDGVPLIGDAAAVIPPLCGDGMAMALRSAALCAPLADAYLRGKISKCEWRRTYAWQLEQAFSSALRWGDRLARLMESPRVAAWLLKLGRHFPAAAGQWFRATRIRL